MYANSLNEIDYTVLMPKVVLFYVAVLLIRFKTDSRYLRTVLRRHVETTHYINDQN